MRKFLKAAAAIMASLFIATGTMSAQEKKQVEKKVITVVTVDEKGVTKDTTIIKSDTLEFEGENLIIHTREGKRIIHKPGEKSRMVFVDSEMGAPGHEAAPGMGAGPAWVMNPDRLEKEGVNYHISVDGVTVTIRAPKEKAAEADQILKEAQKILMKK
jgi:hypothetical protein